MATKEAILKGMESRLGVLLSLRDTDAFPISALPPLTREARYVRVAGGSLWIVVD
ncbi:MAG: hypothetical protein WD066_05740 [Planctomycetaceae bacterium]